MAPRHESEGSSPGDFYGFPEPEAFRPRIRRIFTDDEEPLIDTNPHEFSSGLCSRSLAISGEIYPRILPKFQEWSIPLHSSAAICAIRG